MADTLIRGFVELIERAVGPAITVPTEMSHGHWSVLCDANQEVGNALLNLAINARDAMPEGGVVTLSTQDLRLSRADVAGLDGVEPGEFVEISVADTGVGMTPDVLAHAFEPFFTTKPVGHGPGLGLSQIYGFVRRSGGSVRLDSSLGQGTTVRIFLPRYRDTGEILPAAALSLQRSKDGAGNVILLVKDVSELRTVTAAALRELGYTMLEAEDGPSALRVLGGLAGSTSSSPTWDYPA